MFCTALLSLLHGHHFDKLALKPLTRIENCRCYLLIADYEHLNYKFQISELEIMSNQIYVLLAAITSNQLFRSEVRGRVKVKARVWDRLGLQQKQSANWSKCF